MPYLTLTDLFQEFAGLGDREALRFSTSFRTWRWSYREIASRVQSACGRLSELGFERGDRLVLWSENRPEWVILFWASVLSGIELVPLDYRFSRGLVQSVCEETNPRLLVTGESVMDGKCRFPTVAIREFAECSSSPPPSLPRLKPQDVVQIVYTSGTTGNPQGIVHRHRNICANLEPFRREIERYRKWAFPFQPIRILSLLPLSHMFGQALVLFIPPMLGGACVLCSEAAPRQVMSLIKKERTSVLVVVPRMLANLAREVSRDLGGDLPRETGRGWSGVARRWWRYRAIHRRLGFKFWCFVVGGASLEPELEVFWTRLGFLVLQGYGLTESSPVVAVNHPFNARRGSVGKALDGQTVRLASDGEILVRGESVASRFARDGSAEELLEQDGWLHTGDIGDIDDQGRIYIKGRKKEIVVTSAGLNVYPRDVESVLRRLRGVRDCAVVGIPREGQEEVHAALILEPGAGDPSEVIRQANLGLEEHQRIRSWTVWPQSDFPRTESTSKVKRHEVVRLIQAGSDGLERRTPAGALERIFEEVAGTGIREEAGDFRLAEDLGLTSLDRIELISRLEEHYGVTLDEGAVAGLSTLSELRTNLESEVSRKGAVPAERRPGLRFPRWARRAPVRLLRNGFQRWVMLPLFRRYISLHVSGLERLSRVARPVIFAANHASHLDTPALLCALPSSWRRFVAPAMLKDYFAPHFSPEGSSPGERASATIQYWLACGLFNAFPLPHRMTGVRGALLYAGELVDEGWCPLVFPEGLRSPSGDIQSFQPGVGLLALHLRVPVVPLRIEGTFEVMSLSDRWPRRGSVSIRFGAPLSFEKSDPETVAKHLEALIRRL